jgi:hypothetical protein
LAEGGVRTEHHLLAGVLLPLDLQQQVSRQNGNAPSLGTGQNRAAAGVVKVPTFSVVNENHLS